jgi:hypothetical protein
MPNFQPVVTAPQPWDGPPGFGRPKARRLVAFKEVVGISPDDVAAQRLKAINHRGASGNQYNTQNGFQYAADLDAYRNNITQWDAKKSEMSMQDYSSCYMALMEEYLAGKSQEMHLEDAYADIGLCDGALDDGDGAADLQTQYNYYLQADQDCSGADFELQRAAVDHGSCLTASFTAAGILANYP